MMRQVSKMIGIKRNIEYYLDAFKKLDEGRSSWNWAAFFFQGMWMFYRKMYLYGIFSLLIDCSVFFLITSSHSVSAVFGLSTVFNFAYKCLYGYFGNRIYYSVVKERIADGYHFMDQYKSTSKSLAILFVFLPSVYFYYLADILANEEYFRTKSRGDNSVNEENILKYLAQDKQNHVQGKIAIVASVVLYFASSSFMVDFFEHKFSGCIHTINDRLPIKLNDHISILD